MFKKVKSLLALTLNLQLFANFNTNTTTQTSAGYSMSPTMKTFYDTALLENAREELIFDQFGDKQKMKGNKVEWRKFNTFPKAMTPLTEGVIPDGKSFGMSYIEATTTQHGDYITVSDRLEFEAYDDIIYGATEEMGAAGGATFNTLTRNVLVQGNSVMYAPKSDATAITSRGALDGTCLINPKLINKAVTWLKKNHAPKIKGSYVALIHPSVAEDLRESTEWKDYHKYNDTEPIFKGEIGLLHSVRFIENTECKIHKGADLASNSRTITVNGAVSSASTTVTFDGGTVEEHALKGREILIGTTKRTVSDNTTTQLTLTESVTCADNTVIYPGEGGAGGIATYDTLVLGANAYGILDPQGESMEMIIKDRGQIGGPLEQFSTIGYKFCHGAKILYQERLLRLETASSYSSDDEEN